MERSKGHIVVAIGQQLEKIHRGYILSYRATEFDLIKCGDVETFLDHARERAALYVIGADTGISGTSSHELIDHLSSLESTSEVPILFLRDPQDSSIVPPEGTRFTILSRWSEAREALGIKHLTAATPQKPPTPAETSSSTEASANFYIAPSESSGGAVRDKSTETVKFFGIKKEVKEDGEVSTQLLTEPPSIPVQEAPAADETPHAPPSDMGSMAASLSEIIASAEDRQPEAPAPEAIPEPNPEPESAPRSAPGSAQEPLPEAMPESAQEPAAMPEFAQEPAAMPEFAPAPAPVSDSRVQDVAVTQSHVVPPVQPLQQQPVVSPPSPSSTRPQQRDGQKSAVGVVVIGLVVGIIVVGAVIAAIWWQRAGRNVVVSGPTLGTAELSEGRVAPSSSAMVFPLVGDAGPGEGEADAEGVAVSPSEMSPGIDGGGEQPEQSDAVDEASSSEKQIEFVLPFKYVRSGRAPYNVNHREFRKIIKFITTHRALTFEIIGHGAPDENPSFVNRLGYQRAKEARDLICRRGPMRRRFKLRSAGASVPYVVKGLVGKELINAHRRVVLRVRDEDEE